MLTWYPPILPPSNLSLGDSTQADEALLECLQSLHCVILPSGAAHGSSSLRRRSSRRGAEYWVLSLPLPKQPQLTQFQAVKKRGFLGVKT